MHTVVDMDEEYHTTCDDLNTEIVKKLVALAPTEKVKDTLLLYDVTKNGRQIKRDLTSSDINDLAETGEFFHIPNARSIKTKSTLAGKILQAIENHMMQKCAECTEYYSIEYDSTPALSCRKCGQGAHQTCYDDHPIRAGITLLYTCSLCSINQNQDIPSTQQNTQPIQRDVAPSQSPVNEPEEIDEDEEDSTKKYVITNNTCNFFLKTRCKTGISGRDCKYDHLPVCNKLMRNGIKGPHGCQKGKDCQYFHPHMCRDSLKTRTCNRVNCKYYHVRGTVRSDDFYEGQNEEHPQRQNQSQNYQRNPPNRPHAGHGGFLEIFKQLQQQVAAIQNQLATQCQPPQQVTQTHHQAQQSQVQQGYQHQAQPQAAPAQQEVLQYNQQFPMVWAPVKTQ